jgi:hypothetical protein
MAASPSRERLAIISTPRKSLSDCAQSVELLSNPLESAFDAGVEGGRGTPAQMLLGELGAYIKNLLADRTGYILNRQGFVRKREAVEIAAANKSGEGSKDIVKLWRKFSFNPVQIRKADHSQYSNLSSVGAKAVGSRSTNSVLAI